MTTTAALPAIDTPDISPSAGMRLAPAVPALWRVLDMHGRIVGHLQAVFAPGGIRYRARRFHAASRVFRDLGEFWRVQDALDCLRFTR